MFIKKKNYYEDITNPEFEYQNRSCKKDIIHNNSVSHAIFILDKYNIYTSITKSLIILSLFSQNIFFIWYEYTAVVLKIIKRLIKTLYYFLLISINLVLDIDKNPF